MVLIFGTIYLFTFKQYVPSTFKFDKTNWLCVTSSVKTFLFVLSNWKSKIENWFRNCIAMRCKWGILFVNLVIHGFSRKSRPIEMLHKIVVLVFKPKSGILKQFYFIFRHIRFGSLNRDILPCKFCGNQGSFKKWSACSLATFDHID